MPELPSVFNVNDHEPAGDFSPLPDGEYLAHIVKSEIKNCGENAKDPNGKYISLRYDIIDPKAKGRVIFDNLNVINKNKTACDIANSRLRSICDAVGITGQLTNTESLHGKPLLLKIGTKPATEKYPAGNKIMAIKKAGAVIPGAEAGPAGHKPFDDDDDEDSPF